MHDRHVSVSALGSGGTPRRVVSSLFPLLSPLPLLSKSVLVVSLCVRVRVLIAFDISCVVLQEIGGQDPTPPLEGPQEVRMRDHVMKVLQEKGMEMKPIVSFLFQLFALGWVLR